MTLNDFIKTNINKNMKYNINGTTYIDETYIPGNLKEGRILNWEVNCRDQVILVLVGR